MLANPIRGWRLEFPNCYQNAIFVLRAQFSSEQLGISFGAVKNQRRGSIYANIRKVNRDCRSIPETILLHISIYVPCCFALPKEQYNRQALLGRRLDHPAVESNALGTEVALRGQCHHYLLVRVGKSGYLVKVRRSRSACAVVKRVNAAAHKNSHEHAGINYVAKFTHTGAVSF